MAKLILTGGTGFVGRHVQDALASGRYSCQLESLVVTGRERNRHRGSAQFVRWEAGLQEFPDLVGDALIHAATPVSAYETHTHPGLMLHQIVHGAKSIIEWCSSQKEAPRVLFLSSGAVYGGLRPGSDAWVEDSAVEKVPTSSANAYERGKRAAEALFEAAAMSGVCRLTIARLFTFSGRHLPLDRHFAIGNFVRDAAEGRDIEVRGSGNAVRSYLDGDDLAHWLLTALDTPDSVGRVIHVGSEWPISIRELAFLVAVRAEQLLGGRPKVKVLGETSSIDGYDRYVPSTSVTRELLGVSQTVGLAESIDDMLRFRSAERGRLR